MTPLLSIKGLSKIFGEVPVVDRVDLQVTQGEIVIVVGPSGAGKSTLLRCVNRIEIPTEGSVLLDGVNMAGEQRNGKFVPDAASVTAKKRQRVGMVFQKFNLFAHLTALDNVAIGPRRVLGMKPADARALAAGATREGTVIRSYNETSCPIIRWPTATCRNRSGNGHASQC